MKSIIGNFFKRDEKPESKVGSDDAAAAWDNKQFEFATHALSEVAGLLGMPYSLQREIGKIVIPHVMGNATPEGIQKLIRDNQEFITLASKCWSGTDRQISIAFVIELNRRIRAQSKFEDWQRRNQRQKARHGKVIYGQIQNLDGNCSERCKELEGVTLPFGHRWWLLHYPPHEIGCGCWLRHITQADIDSGKATVTKDEHLPNLQ